MDKSSAPEVADGERPVRCNLCGTALETRYPRVVDPQTRAAFSILGCPSCGLGHTSPRPHDLGRFYGAAYHGDRHGFTARYCAHRRMKFLADVAGAARGRKLLDVGCGDGTFLHDAVGAGWQGVGTELNPDIARRAGLTVVESLEEARALGPFAAVTLWHSLEHLVDPKGAFEQLAGMLEPGGTVLVAVPDAEGLQARLFGPTWFHLDVPRHLHHFGQRALTRLFEGAGLSVGRAWHQELELDLFGWTQSALNRVLPNPNVFFYRLTGRPPGGGAAEVLASFVAGSALTAAAVPATAASTLLRRGGTLVMAARRPSP